MIECSICHKNAAFVKLSQGDQPARWLCESCFQNRFRVSGAGNGLNLPLFFRELSSPVSHSFSCNLPEISADITCPFCGLRYDEYVLTGMAGCADCYHAFSPAIYSALQMMKARE
jgi:protein-arginine kinase activator protein McsA